MIFSDLKERIKKIKEKKKEKGGKIVFPLKGKELNG